MAGKLGKLWVALLALAIVSTTYAQEETNALETVPQRLTDQYKELYNKSESYNNYKVIKNTTLNAFWSTVEDSLAANRSHIQSQSVEIYNLKEAKAEMTKRIETLEKELDEAIARADSLSFLGIDLHKKAYNVIVWTIIAGLAFVTFFAFSAFFRSRKMAVTTRKEFKELVEEFEEYRRTSHKNKVKLGRELQDERNKVEELKRLSADQKIGGSAGKSKATSNM